MKEKRASDIKHDVVNGFIVLGAGAVIIIPMIALFYISDIGVLGAWEGLLWLVFSIYDLSVVIIAGLVIIYREDRLVGRLRPLSVYIRAFRRWYRFHQKVKRA